MNSQPQTQTAQTAPVTQDLKTRLVLWNLRNPRKPLSQAKIGKAIKRHQTQVGRAMNDPRRWPDVAKMVEKYLDRIEAQSQSTQPTTATHA